MHVQAVQPPWGLKGKGAPTVTIWLVPVLREHIAAFEVGVVYPDYVGMA